MILYLGLLIAWSLFSPTVSPPEVTVACMTQLAEAGDVEAQVWLANYYTYDLEAAETVEWEEVEKWWVMAAENGSNMAQAYLAHAYDAMAVNCADDAESLLEQSRMWRLKAAENGNPGAQQAMAWHLLHEHPDDPEALRQAVEWLRKAAMQDDAFSQAMLCELYQERQAIPQAEAITWFLKSSAVEGQTTSYPNSEAMFLEATEPPRFSEETLKRFREAAEQGHEMMTLRLAERYESGAGVPQSDAEAFRLYRMAAQRGNDWAAVVYCRYLLEGYGTPANVEDAFVYLQMKAREGEPTAQTVLGWAYYEGKGVPKSDEMALHYYRAAAEEENPLDSEEAFLSFTCAHDLCPDIWEVDDTLVRMPLEEKLQKAEAGDLEMQRYLGRAYMFGEVQFSEEDEAIGASMERSLYWYRKAAEQGDAGAQWILGALALLGKGVPQSDAVAAEAFQKAAEQDDAIAQQQLAFLYATGRGVPQSTERAAYWFHRALAPKRGKK